MSKYTEIEIARWLVNEIKSCGSVKKDEIIPKIESDFGEEFITKTTKGDKTLNSKIQDKFREFKGNDITWNIGRKAWVLKKNGHGNSSSKAVSNITWSVQPQEIPENVPLDHPSLYLNRELGWLDFNWRVLCQAMDKRNPLLERVRFIAIT
ncbi:MAG TPA: hypothetical protein VJ964_00750, partial [Balneolaceae bacterium]|nr:hypothetical protein [Balneolaceae bacterium]